MKYKSHIALAAGLLAVTCLLSVPGVKAKYVYESSPISLNLETKTTVKVILDASLWDGIPKAPAGAGWWNDPDKPTRFAYRRMMLGENCDPDVYDVPEVESATDIFVGWKGSVNGTEVWLDSNTIFDGRCVYYEASLRRPQLHFRDDVHGAIPESSDWSGSGATATKNFDCTLPAYQAMLPVPEFEGDNFLGWFTMVDDGTGSMEEFEIKPGVQLQKMDYDVYAKWGEAEVTALHDSLNGIVQ